MVLKGKNKKKCKSLVESFKFAFEGLFFSLRNVRNFKI